MTTDILLETEEGQELGRRSSNPSANSIDVTGPWFGGDIGGLSRFLWEDTKHTGHGCHGEMEPECGMQTEWVFYDGECCFCHRWVRLAVRLDRDGSTFRFAAREGETFRALVAQDQREALPPSILVLTRNGRILTRSSAVLHILEKLGGGWRVIAVVARVPPVGIRDLVYRFIAHVRHGLLPKPESACPVMAPEFRARFGP